MTDAARQPLLLVIDDDPGICRFLERFGRSLGYRVESQTGGREMMACLGSLRADVALIDLQMPEVDGLEVLKAIRTADPHCQTILMTGHPSVDTAIEAVKAGALDYLSKPLPMDRLRDLLEQAREETGRRLALLRADQETARRLEFCGMIGRTPVMQDLFSLVRRLAAHARVALVTGETGTGKELVARGLHDVGPRSRKRFVVVNCSAVVESLFESELFGHMRGAFTGATDNKAGLFEAADGGTLFLDEVGELPLAVQAKLLRVLESGELLRVGSLEPKKVDVRVIAATNRHLDAEVAGDRFRRDLLYRLNVVQVSIPPLRDRREDVPYLTASFVAACRDRFQTPVSGVSPAAERLLFEYAWPGNVRELRNVIERACMLADGDVLNDRDIRRALPASEGSFPGRDAPGVAATPAVPKNVLKAVEMEQIHRALAEAGGNKSEAARKLGVSRRLLYRRLEQPAEAAPAVHKERSDQE